jgi:hypothetical protein
VFCIIDCVLCSLLKKVCAVCACPYVPLERSPNSPIPFFKINFFVFSLEVSAKLSNVLINCKGNSMADKVILQKHNCIRTQYLSLRTEEAYLQRIKRYILFHHKRHPTEIGENEIRSFLTNLTCRKHVSSSNQHQVSNTIIFYFSQYCINHLGNLAIFCLRSAGVAKKF